MRIRAAVTEHDLGAVCRLRMDFVADHRGRRSEELDDSFVEATHEWVSAQHRSGRLHSWLAAVEGDDIGLASVALHDIPPRPEDPRNLDGRLLNVWVAPTHRRAGIGSALVEACLLTGPTLGVRSWSLHATDDGRPVYERHGFTTNAAWMQRLDVVKSD